MYIPTNYLVPSNSGYQPSIDSVRPDNGDPLQIKDDSFTLDVNFPEPVEISSLKVPEIIGGFSSNIEYFNIEITKDEEPVTEILNQKVCISTIYLL